MLFATDMAHIKSMKATPPKSSRPPPETIAVFVKFQRALMGWKQSILAVKAGISLSTIQRIERGESVSVECLDRLAVALNQRPGTFTEERQLLSNEEAVAHLEDSLAWLDGTVAIPVAPLRRETQLREVANTELSIIGSDLGEAAEADIAVLREWLDLLSFVRAEDGTLLSKRERSFRLRRLYKDILDSVSKLERQHKAVCLAGTYEPRTNLALLATARVAIIALRSRENNPAAGLIRQLFAPEIVDAKAAWLEFIEEA